MYSYGYASRGPSFLERLLASFSASMIGPMIAALISGLVLSYCIRWFIFKKAGEQGWKALIPFYSDYINYKIVWDGKIYLVLLVGTVATTVIGFIFGLIHSGLGIIVTVLLSVVVTCAKNIADLILQFKYARAFGKGDFFAVGLFFLNSIFTAVLAFGESKYKGAPKDDGFGTPKFLENLGQRPAYNPNAYMPMQQPMPGQPVQPVYPVQPGQPVQVVVQPGQSVQVQPQSVQVRPQPVLPQQPMQPAQPAQPAARPVQPQEYPSYRTNTTSGFQPVQIRVPQMNQQTSNTGSYTPVQPQQPAPQQPAQQPIDQNPSSL